MASPTFASDPIGQAGYQVIDNPRSTGVTRVDHMPAERTQMGEVTTAAAAGPQCMRALECANEVRLARAELKRRIRSGKPSVAEVILGRCWETDTMTVADLLVSQHGWGPHRVRKYLKRIPMSETKTVGSMTDRQRRVLAALLS